MREITQLFLVFLKIGTFTFGGGYAMVPALRKDTVEKHGWLSEEEFVDIVATCQALPGAFATNFALYLGLSRKGWPGAIASAIATILPAFVVIIAVLLFLGMIEDNPYVQGAFNGIMAASTALILATVIGMTKRVLKNKLSYFIAVSSFVIIVAFKFSAIWAILLGGVLGFLMYLWNSRTTKAEE